MTLSKFIKFIVIIFIVILSNLFVKHSGIMLVASDNNNSLITTRSDFIKAINNANDGDELLVGDINFNLPYTGAVNETEKIIIEKNITIKNGKSEGNAIFVGASFILNGTKSANDVTAYKFIDITFDEQLDVNSITSEDWELSFDSQGEKIGMYPLKCQYAIECKGNTKANFENCEFKNYMHTYGPAIRAFYGDYTLTPSIEAEHGDNVPYILELNIINCDFSSNASLYGGGAIYIEAESNNVLLNVVDSTFKDNKSGFIQNAVGGGAIYTKNTEASFSRCHFENNNANYFYGGEQFYVDTIIGGAIGCSNKTNLRINNSTIIGNKASNGGGIGIQESIADIVDCYIRENNAIPSTDDKASKRGIASQMGLGGAIYLNSNTSVSIRNTEIRSNYAENVFGAIFADYNPLLDYSTYSVDLLFCTILDNVCGTVMDEYQGYGNTKWLWFSYPGDFFDISYLECYGNLIVDSVYQEFIPKHEEASESNGYNYFSCSVPDEWYNDKLHLVNGPIIPTEFIKDKLGEGNYYGTFTVGANNHDVTFKFYSDGECKDSVTLESGKMPILPKYEKIGYTLSSWKLDESIDYYPGLYLIVGNATSSVDFHAIYSQNVYKITFDFGNMQTVEIEQLYNDVISFPEAVEKQGFTFIGWFTEKEGDGTEFTDEDVFLIANDVTLYAAYEKNFPLGTVLMISVGVLLTTGMLVLSFSVIKNKKQMGLVNMQAENIQSKESPDISMLSIREKEVLALLLEGKQRSEIASILFISENTVKKQITSIYSKLGVSSRNELFALFK